ncbi:MAG TPA: SDR family oxidoreductase [Nitrospirales bacterium]|nr:SDR family oxidoreductase [Nitrospirales bacterium]
MKLNGKVVLITGGGTGIGEATAKLFAVEGALVTITGRRKDVLENVAKVIVANGGKALAIAGSVTDEAHVQSAVDQTVRTFGKIDILVNNAAIGGFGKQLHDITDQEWQEILDTNLTGVFRVTRAVIPHMLGRGGAIVNVSSVAGMVAIQKSVAYSATKGALLAMTRCLAIDYAKEKIRCNCVCPALVDTPMAADAIADPALNAAMAAAHPIGRFGTPDDVARLLLYLASDDASWVTGSIFTIDGGLTAQ